MSSSCRPFTRPSASCSTSAIPSLSRACRVIVALFLVSSISSTSTSCCRAPFRPRCAEFSRLLRHRNPCTRPLSKYSDARDIKDRCHHRAARPRALPPPLARQQYLHCHALIVLSLRSSWWPSSRRRAQTSSKTSEARPRPSLSTLLSSPPVSPLPCARPPPVLCHCPCHHCTKDHPITTTIQRSTTI